MKRWLWGLAMILGLGLGVFLFSEHPYIWPVRHLAQYHLLQGWWSVSGGPPATEGSGVLSGRVQTATGAAVPNAWVLVSSWDGSTHRTRSTTDGGYRLTGLPPGYHRPVATAPGYAARQVETPWPGLHVGAGETAIQNIELTAETRNTVVPGQNFRLDAEVELTCTAPVESQAIEQAVHFEHEGQPNQTTFYYRPLTTTTSLPILLTIYPGPAESWRCVSLPLAQAGYAVIGAGPAYSFDLEADIDELFRLVKFAREGRFPQGRSDQLLLLGGSYSTLHVQRMLQRDPDFVAAVLLGPPTELFEMRRQLELGAFLPPFGLDQAMISLGLPNRRPALYWRYSSVYHVRSDFPPQLLMHSRFDEVVPFQQSEHLAEALSDVGAPYELHLLDAASHYLMSSGGEADEVYQLTLDFMQRSLEAH